MIAFIEGGMRIPMVRVTRDFLIAYRLYPTQCSPNVFRILSSMDALNEKMGINLTHHDVNWVYNCQLLKSMRYYLKTRVPEVRLISCLPKSNKGMDQDFLIISEKRHSGLHCPTREEKLGVVLKFRFPVLTMDTLTFQLVVSLLITQKFIPRCLPNSFL